MMQVPRRWHRPSWERIARVTHVHLLALAALWVLTGSVVLLSGPAGRGRTVVASAPLLGVALDAAGMWLAPLAEVFVWASIVGGGMMGAGFLCEFLLVIYALWLGCSDGTENIVR